MQKLFSLSFKPDQHPMPEDIASIAGKIPEIDTLIQRAAPQWPLSKIARIDLAVLRLAVWELFFDAKEPPKVIVDEAVELAKSYGNEKSGQFVNGALGALIETQKKEEA